MSCVVIIFIFSRIYSLCALDMLLIKATYLFTYLRSLFAASDNRLQL